jgi:hypothetical protein
MILFFFEEIFGVQIILTARVAKILKREEHKALRPLRNTYKAKKNFANFAVNK